MTDINQTEAKTPAEAAQLEAAQTSAGKAVSTGAAIASNGLSEDDLKTVAGGIFKMGARQSADL